MHALISAADAKLFLRLRGQSRSQQRGVALRRRVVKRGVDQHLDFGVMLEPTGEALPTGPLRKRRALWLGEEGLLAVGSISARQCLIAAQAD